MAEIRLPCEGLWLPALTLSALPDAILVATFTDLAVGTVVDVALPDPDGPIIADGVVASVGPHGTRIVFYDVSSDLRERLDAFSRRGLLFDEPFSEDALEDRKSVA